MRKKDQCSNQCEHIYAESGLGKHVDRRIYVKDKQCMSEMPFDENMAENRQVGELKMWLLFKCSFIVHTFIIKKG